MKQKKSSRTINRKVIVILVTALTLMLIGVLSLGIAMCMSVDDPFDTYPIWMGEQYFDVPGLEICTPSRYREFRILDADEIQSDIAIELGLDDGKLAGIFSDGRIVIWDKYEVVAEYASYRSMLDYYAEHP